MHYIGIKEGVDLSEMSARITSKLLGLASIFKTHGQQMEITSARRQPALKFSYHHIGMAIDLRANDIATHEQRIEILDDIRRYLGEDYDVILHGKDMNIHYHIEYDPVKPTERKAK